MRIPLLSRPYHAIRKWYYRLPIDPTTIEAVIREEGVNVWVASYGGSCTNSLADALVANGYVCKTRLWTRGLCHFPFYVEAGVPTIYIYDDPVRAYLSVKRRYWRLNQMKLANTTEVAFSDEKLLLLMLRQFESWCMQKSKHLLVLRTVDVFAPEIRGRLCRFLKCDDLSGFPLPYTRPQTSLEDASKSDLSLFDKYRRRLDFVRAWEGP